MGAKREALVFFHPAQVGEVTVSEGEKLVLIGRLGVEVAPCEPGTWEVSLESLLREESKEPVLPMVMVPVPASHVAAFLAMTQEQIADLIGCAETSYKRAMQ
jgi:hypothetical protein